MTMDLKEIGEFGFIKRFANRFDKFIKDNELGIGDDCAIIPINNSESYVVTTDLLNEDIHFLKDKITPQELGYKSLAVNLSDLAAMGAEPKFSFLSIAIPNHLSVEYLDNFMDGFYSLSEKYNLPLMGGDTTKSIDKLLINVLVIGQCKNEHITLRSMAKKGDLVCTTGLLGDSAGGLKVILGNLAMNNENKYLMHTHNNPIPRIKEGKWLATQPSVHAMMDISDGISSDLMHILKASNKAAKIHVEKLPISSQLNIASKNHGWNIIDLVTSGGEDYELLFTVDAKDIERLRSEYNAQFSEDISIIGTIEEGSAQIEWFTNGERMKERKSGFNHFTK